MELVQIIKQNKFLKYFLYVLIGSTLLTISAKIKLPFYPVPMTMQTFMVLLIGVLLGSKLGAATILFYLLEGILGLPVFSNSPEKGIGLIYFTGPTMGYLIGFIFACYFAGYIKINDNYLIILIKLFFSVSIIYIFGLLWLGNLIGWEKPIFELGAKPFLLAEIFKIILLVIMCKYLTRLREII